MEDYKECSACLTKTKITTLTLDGKDICIPCSDIQDWVDTISIGNKSINRKQIEIKAIEKPVKKEIVNMIPCPRCKNKFSGRNCSCGFKNPLFK